jgi:hypothetical protein
MLSRRDFIGIENQMKALSQEQQELESAGFESITVEKGND